MKNLKNSWHRLILLLILVLAGFLSFYGIGKEGYANEYYSSAVKSMLLNWHNFFFVSFDPGGYVSVDKPALGLWLQTLSAWIFGFHGWSLILPEVLSTIVSTAVLYHLVQRTFGTISGLISALVLALTPVLIAVSRTNNLDASLVMVLMLATWALIVAAERSSFKLLLLSMTLVGLGFNIKMLQAFMVLPAFYLAYLFASSLKIGRKMLHITGATAVLLAVSLSWAVIVDLTLSDKRPYVGSSSTNSVIELALGYNGIQRVVPSGNPAGTGMPSMGSSNSNKADSENKPRGNPPGGNAPFNMQAPPNAENAPDSITQGNNTQSNGPNPMGEMSRPAGGPGGGGPGGGGGFGGGNKGIFRMFNQKMAGQISWLIPLALFGFLAASLRARKRVITGNLRAKRSVLLWGAWIAPMFVYFSIAGFFHPYYTTMLAPGLAALAGIGMVEMWKAYLDKGWKGYLLPTALVTNAAVQGIILSRYPVWSKALIPVACGISAAAAVTLITLKILKRESQGKSIKILVAAGFAALLIAPAIWSYTPIIYGSDTQIPKAGPELNRGNRGGSNMGAGAMKPLQKNTEKPENTETSRFIKFLLSNRQNEKFLVAVPDSHSATSIILETGQPIMAVGGFLGTDNILTAVKLEKMVKDGEIRYFEVGGEVRVLSRK